MAFEIPSPARTVPIGRYATDANVVSAFRKASAETGAGFATLVASAALESGLNPAAKASNSTASGLFQFTEQTWLAAIRQFGPAHGLQTDAAAIVSRGGELTVDDPGARQRILNLRFDPNTSATIAGDHLQSLASNLTAALGHTPDATETYLAHFLGSTGAAQMLKAAQSTPQRQAADVLPEAARANAAAFTASDGSPRSAAQFVQRVHDRLAHAFAETGSAMPQGSLSFANAGSEGIGASGHGIGLARSSATPPERAMLASLVDVFTRMDRGDGARRPAHAKGEHRLPFGMVAALQPLTEQDPLPPPSHQPTGT